MGLDIFSDSQGAGQTAAHALLPTPTAGAGTSLYRANAGMKLSMIGEGLSGLDSLATGLYQSRVMNNNAAISERNAKSALEAGQNQESLFRLQAGQQRGERKVATAAGNIDVGSGAPQDVERSANLIDDLDAATIRYSAQREAYNNRIEAMSQRTNAGFARDAGFAAFAKSGFKVESTYIGGASSLATKWQAMQDAGLNG